MDYEKWNQLERGSMLLNGEVLSIQQWLNDLRVEWKLDANGIRERETQQRRELEASVSIGRWWRKKRTSSWE